MKGSDQRADPLTTYYSTYDEQARLSDSWGQVEFIRTQDIIGRYLDPPPAVVLDVGGAAGRYSCWLAEQGYEVHLVDPVPLHIQQAKEASERQPQKPIASCSLGDARQLEFEAESAAAVLLLGPLYHLVQAQDRRRALLEAYRVLKTGGYLFAAGISRFASTIDGLKSGYYLDPEFQAIMTTDLESGHHQNPTQNPAYFMETFFHHPEGLRKEVGQAGFGTIDLLAVESISYLIKDFEESWKNDARREFLLHIIRKIEREPTLMGASPHVMCVAVKP